MTEPHAVGELLARIDERTEHMMNDLKEFKSDFRDFRTEVQRVYVTRAEFLPVKVIAYGLVGTTMTAVVGGVLAVVFAI